jgi:hypothetical protein
VDPCILRSSHRNFSLIMLYSILHRSLRPLSYGLTLSMLFSVWCVCTLLDSYIIGFSSVYRFPPPSLNDSARIRVLSCCLSQIPNQSTYVRLGSRT